MSQKIYCPTCGREYFPEEIFMKGDMYGNPNSIIRDEQGKIIHYEGKSLNYNETYTCDKCDTFFRVVGKVDFKAFPAPSTKFDEDYVSSYKRISLSEI